MGGETLEVKSENIPQELKAGALWCLWEYEDRNGRKTKVPYRPVYWKERAKSNNPKTFGSFDDAWKYYHTYESSDGIGIGAFNGFGAVDIDNCVEDGKVSDMAQDIINIMDSYTEYSPSGKGIRIIFKADGFIYDKDKYYKNNQKKGLEVYISGCTKKFVTITGNVIKKSPITDKAAEISQVLEKYMLRTITEKPHKSNCKSKDSYISDEEYNNRGLEKDIKYRQLYDGNRESQDESANDLAIMNKIAYWCNGNDALMEKVFRESPYFAQKDPEHTKKGNRQDYIDMTIKAAISGLSSTAEQDNKAWKLEQARNDFKETTNKPSLVSAVSVPYESPRWLIAPYFQRGKGTLIQADNGTGKTAFMCAVAAHVSTGNPLLNILIQTPGNVLILSVEDDLPVLRGRIEASGGNLKKCFFMANAAGLTFNSPEVEEAVKQISARMVIFDPFQAFLGASINMDKSNQTRPELAKLFEMGDRNDCSIAIIAHMGKGTIGSSAVNRSLGSVDIPSAMRSIFQIIRNPENEDECIAVHVKCSNAPKGRSIAYSIGDRGGVHWNRSNPMTADDLNIVVKRKEKGIPYENEPLVKVFNQLIADKPGGGFWS